MEPPPKNRKRTSANSRTGFPLPPRLDSDSVSDNQALLGKGGRQKKKKRSHLANASNPHHLRNYVPSRLPQQPLPLTQASLAAANLISPPAMRFLSAQIPPRRRKRSAVPLAPLPLTNPLDEWICPSCEYNLFYGDESGFKRAIKNRKKILSRRRRARERAAAAASGIPSTIPEKSAHTDHLENDNILSTIPANPSQTGTKKDRQLAPGDDILK